MDRRKLSRREFLRAGTVVSAGIALAACTVPAAAPAPAPAAQGAAAPAAESKATEAPKAEAPAAATNLVIWTFGSFFTDFYNKIFPKYKELAPTVSLKVEESTQEFDNLQAALAAGTGAPDIADIEQGAMSRFFKGEIGLIDLTDQINAHKDDYVMARTDPYAFKGKMYGIDHCLCPVVLFYRWDLFEKAGIKMPIATWQEFKEIAIKFKDTGAAALSLSDRGWGTYHILLTQRGTGGFFDGEGNPILDGADNVDTLQWYADMIKSGAAVVSPQGDAVYAQLGEGKIGSQIGADWYGGFIKNNVKDAGKGKWMAAPLPAWKAGGSRTSADGGTGYCITKQSKAPQESWKFIEWAMFNGDNKFLEYQINGLLSPVKSQLADPRWLSPDEWFNGQALGKLYLEVAPEQNRHNRSPYFTEATTLVNDAVFSVVSEGKPAAEALKTAQTELLKQMQA